MNHRLEQRVVRGGPTLGALNGPSRSSTPQGMSAFHQRLLSRMRPLFWLFAVMFNFVGFIELVFDYYHAIQVGLPAAAGELGAAYAIPIIYVPLLMITHVVAFYLLARPLGKRQNGTLLQGRQDQAI